MSDIIKICGLETFSHIGVTEKERSRQQRLRITIELKVESIKSAALTDEVSTTIDYAQVAERVKEIVGERPRKLIETLAEDVASNILSRYPVKSVYVDIRKFILPETEYVGVSISRKRPKNLTQWS
ncbi:MAG: dihydroneopterin aldolase [Verrucomicrobiota bacterium]